MEARRAELEKKRQKLEQLRNERLKAKEEKERQQRLQAAASEVNPHAGPEGRARLGRPIGHPPTHTKTHTYKQTDRLIDSFELSPVCRSPAEVAGRRFLMGS